jgi:hypothetical protein
MVFQRIFLGRTRSSLSVRSLYERCKVQLSFNFVCRFILFESLLTSWFAKNMCHNFFEDHFEALVICRKHVSYFSFKIIWIILFCIAERKVFIFNLFSLYLYWLKNCNFDVIWSFSQCIVENSLVSMVIAGLSHEKVG